MSASAGKAVNAGPSGLLQKADQRETSDLAFLDNIEELNTNWPDYQVRAGSRTGLSGIFAPFLLLWTLCEIGGPALCTAAMTGVPERY